MSLSLLLFSAFSDLKVVENSMKLTTVRKGNMIISLC